MNVPGSVEFRSHCLSRNAGCKKILRQSDWRWTSLGGVLRSCSRFLELLFPCSAEVRLQCSRMSVIAGGKKALGRNGWCQTSQGGALLFCSCFSVVVYYHCSENLSLDAMTEDGPVEVDCGRAEIGASRQSLLHSCQRLLKGGPVEMNCGRAEIAIPQIHWVFCRCLPCDESSLSAGVVLRLLGGGGFRCGEILTAWRRCFQNSSSFLR
jgi:hypothetical protein